MHIKVSILCFEMLCERTQTPSVDFLFSVMICIQRCNNSYARRDASHWFIPACLLRKEPIEELALVYREWGSTKAMDRYFIPLQNQWSSLLHACFCVQKAEPQPQYLDGACLGPISRDNSARSEVSDRWPEPGWPALSGPLRFSRPGLKIWEYPPFLSTSFFIFFRAQYGNEDKAQLLSSALYYEVRNEQATTKRALTLYA